MLSYSCFAERIGGPGINEGNGKGDGDGDG